MSPDMALYKHCIILSLCAVLRDRLLHGMLSLRFVNGLILKTLFVCFCLYAGARAVTKKLTVKPRSEHIQREPSWKARLKKQIKELRANLSKLQ